MVFGLISCCLCSTKQIKLEHGLGYQAAPLLFKAGFDAQPLLFTGSWDAFQMYALHLYALFLLLLQFSKSRQSWLTAVDSMICFPFQPPPAQKV